MGRPGSTKSVSTSEKTALIPTLTRGTELFTSPMTKEESATEIFYL